MDNISQKTDETKIAITIYTGQKHDPNDELELARQQIEKSLLYLKSIFFVLRLAGFNLEDGVRETDAHEFGGELANLCEIGDAVSDSIFISLAALNGCEKTGGAK